MCVDFKLGPLPSEFEPKRLLRQEFMSRLKQIPLDYYSITSKRLPQGLLRKNQLAEYKKLLIAILNSDSLQSFLRTCETAWFSDEVRSYALSDWVEYIKYKTEKDEAHQYLREAFVCVMDAEKWLDSARSVLEAEFAYKMLEDDDKPAREILIRRFGEHWSERLQAIKAQARMAKELADTARATDGNSTINFVLAGT